MDIARDYERYIRGTQGFILSHLPADANGNPIVSKTVALITNYDIGTGEYTIGSSHNSDGTATTNRYLEATANVANSYNDTLGDITALASDLADVDLLLVGGQASAANQTVILNALYRDALLSKTYYVDALSSEAPAAIYGVVMNSVENAQNIGRILPALYPEIFYNGGTDDTYQSDYIAWYFDHFYHTNVGSRASAMALTLNNFGGTGAGVVRSEGSTINLEPGSDWQSVPITYDEGSVAAQIADGVTFLKDWEDLPNTNIPDALVPSQYI
jgi:hypothetical protein